MAGWQTCHSKQLACMNIKDVHIMQACIGNSIFRDESYGWQYNSACELSNMLAGVVVYVEAAKGATICIVLLRLLTCHHAESAVS